MLLSRFECRSGKKLPGLPRSAKCSAGLRPGAMESLLRSLRLCSGSRSTDLLVAACATCVL
jgi:hypothetical protein